MPPSGIIPIRLPRHFHLQFRLLDVGFQPTVRGRRRCTGNNQDLFDGNQTGFQPRKPDRWQEFQSAEKPFPIVLLNATAVPFTSAPSCAGGWGRDCVDIVVCRDTRVKLSMCARALTCQSSGSHTVTYAKSLTLPAQRATIAAGQEC